MSAAPDREDDVEDRTRARSSEDLADVRDEIADLRGEIEAVEAELNAFEADVDERTVHRSAVESELRRYVRSRMRRGHARGWGPYLVLLYGTAMTLGAFVELSGGWAILAMIVIWLSTLGLYTLMLIVGAGLAALSLPGSAAERIRNFRG